MYGLVNQGVAELVRAKLGEEAWQEIAEKVDTDEDFLAMDQYPDRVTYDLVGAVSERMQAEPEVVLDTFGQHWAEFTGRAGYGEVFSQMGRTVRAICGNLNVLHAQLKRAFPDLIPPRFEVRDLDDGVFELDYHSTREGLASMVGGLLKGIAAHTGETLEVEHLRLREDQGHDTFLVRVVGG